MWVVKWIFLSYVAFIDIKEGVKFGTNSFYTVPAYWLHINRKVYKIELLPSLTPVLPPNRPT